MIQVLVNEKASYPNELFSAGLVQEGQDYICQ